MMMLVAIVWSQSIASTLRMCKFFYFYTKQRPRPTLLHSYFYLVFPLILFLFYLNVHKLSWSLVTAYIYHLMLTKSSITTSSHINIIINVNLTSYQLMSSIATSTVSHIPHIHIYFMPEIHTPQVFIQHHSQFHSSTINISHPIS